MEVAALAGHALRRRREADAGLRQPEYAHQGCVLRSVPAGEGPRLRAAAGLRHTPKHGSWLNVAECELSCMTSQCLSDRRIGELATLQSEIAAWSIRVNEKQRAVDWQFTIDKARVKLKRLYPNVEPGRDTSLIFRTPVDVTNADWGSLFSLFGKACRSSDLWATVLQLRRIAQARSRVL